jgi:hypothetical protein
MKFVFYVVLALAFWSNPVHASCYNYRSGDTATINLENKKNGYYRIWKDRNQLQLAAKLRHGSEIKVVKFIETGCGGDVYLESTVNGRTIKGWTFSDSLFYLTR